MSNAGRRKIKVHIDTKYIRRLIKECGLNQRQVAEKLADAFDESVESSAPYLSRCLKNEEMTSQKVDALAKIFDVIPDTLLNLSDFANDRETFPMFLYLSGLKNARPRPCYAAKDVLSGITVKERAFKVLSLCRDFGMVNPTSDEIFEWYQIVDKAMQEASRDFLIRTGHVKVEEGNTHYPDLPRDANRSYIFSNIVDKADPNAFIDKSDNGAIIL